MERAIDPLVVAARTLDEGVRWVERELGARPQPRGERMLAWRLPE